MTASKKDLWYRSQGVVHRSTKPCANRIMRWSGWDSKQLFEKHCSNPNKKRILEEQGFLDLERISYRYNHQGFRSDEFDNRPAGVALGCSFTEGTGLPLKDTWPSVLSELLNYHIWNLGVGGSGLDTCFRVLDYYLNILNIKFVVLCSPSPLRLEFFDRYDEPRTFIAMHLDTEKYRDFAEEWLTSDLNTKSQARRNILAMKWRCHEKNVPFFELSSIDHLDQDALARDLAHPGVQANKKFADLFYNKIKQSVNLT